MMNEMGFITKVLNMIEGELKQLERMLAVMKSDEDQMAYLRGERMRLTQMKMVMEERRDNLQQHNTNTELLGDWQETRWTILSA